MLPACIASKAFGPVSGCYTGDNANFATGQRRKWAIFIITSNVQPYDGTAYNVLVIKARRIEVETDCGRGVRSLQTTLTGAASEARGGPRHAPRADPRVPARFRPNRLTGSKSGISVAPTNEPPTRSDRHQRSIAMPTTPLGSPSPTSAPHNTGASRGHGRRRSPRFSPTLAPTWSSRSYGGRPGKPPGRSSPRKDADA